MIMKLLTPPRPLHIIYGSLHINDHNVRWFVEKVVECEKRLNYKEKNW